MRTHKTWGFPRRNLFLLSFRNEKRAATNSFMVKRASKPSILLRTAFFLVVCFQVPFSSLAFYSQRRNQPIFSLNCDSAFMTAALRGYEMLRDVSA